MSYRVQGPTLQHPIRFDGPLYISPRNPEATYESRQARRVSGAVRGLVGGSLRLLPVQHRARYAEELLAELCGVAGGGAGSLPTGCDC